MKLESTREPARVGLVLAVMLSAFAASRPAPPRAAQSPVLSLEAARAVIGDGGEREAVRVIIEGSRIVRVGGRQENPPAGAVRYDLARYTLLPGLIDTHVHLTSHFDAGGRVHTSDAGLPPGHEALYAAENGYRMLMGGFTTVQSLGSPADAELRAAFARGVLPGPRVLTSLRSISERTGGPDQIRRFVQEAAAAGADIIKVFASASLRDGGAPTLSFEQLDAACGEAHALGLRSAVHAHGPESVRRAVRAGCSSIEHGALLDRETLELLAKSGTWFDPNIHLVSVNYLENRDRFIGTGNFTEEAFRLTSESIPVKLEMFRTALSVPGLRIAFGTDGVAGSFPRLAEELIYRVERAGQDPAAALLSATSGAAASLGLADRIGRLAPGMEADIIAVDGDPLRDITALRRVVFVMRGGRVYLSPPTNVGPR